MLAQVFPESVDLIMSTEVHFRIEAYTVSFSFFGDEIAVLSAEDG